MCGALLIAWYTVADVEYPEAWPADCNEILYRDSDPEVHLWEKLFLVGYEEQNCGEYFTKWFLRPQIKRPEG